MTVNNSFRCVSYVPSQPYVYQRVAIQNKYDLFQNLQLGPFLHGVLYGGQAAMVPRSLIPYGDSVIERFVLDRAFYIASCKGRKNDAFLEGMDVEVVESTPSTYRQIAREEYLGMRALYKEIAGGRTFLRIEGTEDFKSKFLSAVKKLMERPSGRAIIVSLCRTAFPIEISSGEASQCFPLDSSKRFRMTLNLDTTLSFPCFTPQEQWRFVPCKNHIILAHEGIHLLHLLHFLNFHPLAYHASIDIGSLPYPDGNYSNIMERLTICGDAPYGGLLMDIPECGLLCENLVRYEFDEPLRYGHVVSVFPPFKEEDREWINEKSVINFKTRIEEAAQLGLYDEVKMLLDHGANPQEGLRGGVKGGISKIINLCLDRGASFPASECRKPV